MESPDVFGDVYDQCFGCGAGNEAGLRMTYDVTGRGTVRSSYTVPTPYAGAPGVVHGGIQATLLDEVGGFAVRALVAELHGTVRPLVTAEFQLRYRRPVPTETELVLVGEVVDFDGRDATVEARIVTPDDDRATVASSRWVLLDA